MCRRNENINFEAEENGITGAFVIDCMNNGRSSRDVTRWFVDCRFEASQYQTIVNLLS